MLKSRPMNARWVVLLHMTADKRLAPYAAGALKKLRKLPASSGVEVAVELDMRDGRKPKRFRIDGGLRQDVQRLEPETLGRFWRAAIRWDKDQVG